MKKAILCLMVLLFIPLALAVTDDAEVYYSFDNADLSGSNPQDLSGNTRHGTNNGATTGATGILNEGFDFVSGDPDYVSIPSYEMGNAVSFSAWVNITDLSATRGILGPPTGTYSAVFYVGSDGAVSCRLYEDASTRLGRSTNTGAIVADSGLHHVVCTYTGGTNNDNIDIWVDGSEVDTTSSGAGSYTAYNSNPGVAMKLGMWEQTTLYFDGIIDEYASYSRVLTNGEIAELYNSGSGYNPYFVAPSDPYATIQVFDEYDNASLSGLTVWVGTESNTTDGTGSATVYTPTGLNYTVDGGSNYFNTSGTATENATVQTSIYGALPNVSAYNVEGDNILIFNLTSPETSNTTSGGSSLLLLPPNATTDLNVSVENYYLLETNITTTGQDTSNKNVTGLYQSILGINSTNAYTGASLSNFTGWAYNNETGYNYTFNDSETGQATLYLLFGNYTVYLDVFGYSVGEDNFQEIELSNNSLQNITFPLYSENSITINVYDEDTSNTITDNITIIISGGLYEETFYTTSGTLFVENLTDGNYSAKLSGDNYTQKTYEFTVADRSTQTLNAYLSGSTATVTFTFIDDNTFQTIESVSVSQQRVLNGSWVTVGSKSSDITGRAQFIYTVGVKYRFTVTKTGYTNKVFELDPIIFTSYNIQLVPTQAIEEEYGLFNVNWLFYPKVFVNNQVNNLTVAFDSPEGAFSSYGAYISSPNGTSTQTGTNAYGDQLDFTFLLNNTLITDSVNITVFYQSVYGENKTYSYRYPIQGTAENGTFTSISNTNYGLGTFEKVFIATIVTIIAVGLVTLFTGSLIGLITALFLTGFFVSIGFLSLWFAIPTFLIGSLFLMRGSNE